MRDVLSYMNVYSYKEYDIYKISAIQNAIVKEYKDRKNKGIKINGRTKVGRNELNKRVADMANEILGSHELSSYDVWIYKKCNALEYQDRTGRCAWGYKNIRKRLGYDQITGLEKVSS